MTSSARQASFNIGIDSCQGMLLWMWRQFHGSGGGIERVFTSAGKQHYALKKNTRRWTPHLKAGINTEFPTCDDEGVFNDDDDTYRKRK